MTVITVPICVRETSLMLAPTRPAARRGVQWRTLLELLVYISADRSGLVNF